MKTAIVLLIAAVAVQAASAHMCLLQPMQRGGAANAQHMIDDAVCAHTTACAGGVEGPSVLTVACGATVTISWIKNVNHWYYSNPGAFTVTTYQNGKALGGPFITLADTNTTDLTRYSVNWPIPPMIPNGFYTLQVEYITGRGFNFYQCTDITVTC